MGFEGARAVIDVTGEYPVYPGHPLTVAWEIMSVFQSPEQALQTVKTNGLNCPESVADSRISGGSGEVHRACDLLRLARQGANPAELIKWADEKWVAGQAGGHVKAIQPGLAQAEKIKPLFGQKLAAWLAAATSTK